MATLHIPEQNQIIRDSEKIAAYVAPLNLNYQQCFPAVNLPEQATQDEILAAYKADLAPLMEKGGYSTADVISLNPNTPNLDALLNKFNQEHCHAEDEVRFTLAGHGLFHIHHPDSPVIAIEVEAGDLLVVPKGTLHWFDLCRDRYIKVIRLFQNPQGWTPEYTHSHIEQQYQPLCFGSNFAESAR